MRAPLVALVVLALCDATAAVAQPSEHTQPQQHTQPEERLRPLAPGTPAAPTAERPAGQAELLPLFSLRVAAGGAGYVAPQSAFHFDLDLTAGFRLGILVRSLWLAPLIEAGYSVHEGSRELGRGDYFVLGAGLSLGTLEIAGTLVPAYVVGVSEGDTVHGSRTAARADFFLGVFSVEVAHEWRAVRGADVHSIRFTATIDLGIVLSWAVRAASGSP